MSVTPETMLHATALQIAGKGILLTGPSGSGKSQLALRLMEIAKAADLPFALVADDGVVMVQEGDLWLMRPPKDLPKNLIGQLELRGFGLIQLPYLNQAIYDCGFLLHRDETQLDAHRMVPLPEDQPKITLHGLAGETIALPILSVFTGDKHLSAQIILSHAGFALPL